jgi:hypothetical protein
VLRDFSRLIEPSRASLRSMKRNRHGKIRILKHACAGRHHEPGKWTRNRSMPVVLQRVNNRPERSVVLANRAAV